MKTVTNRQTFHTEYKSAEGGAHSVALRGIRAADWCVDRFVDVVFLLLLLIGIYFMYDSAYVFYHSRAAVVGPYKPDGADMTALKELSEDVVGWITLDDTTIDYPVMQGKTNFEYLNKDPFGKFSLSGSIYLDSRNASDFSDAYSLVYGHHMSGEYMFGALDLFADEAYFEEHTTGTLTTERGKFPVTVIAFYQTDASDSMVFDVEMERNDMAGYIESHAERFREAGAAQKKIVALTTCKSPTTTKRTAVFVVIEEDQKIE